MSRSVHCGAALFLLFSLVVSACAKPPNPLAYGLSDLHSPVDLQDPAYAELRKRYPGFFRLLAYPARAHRADLRLLASDIESSPVSSRNLESLDTIALAYFYLHEHRKQWPGGSPGFYDSTFMASLLALPWSAYKRGDPVLRDAILAFYEDLVRREGMIQGRNARRLASNLARLEPKEKDAARQRRLGALAAQLREEIAP